MEKKIRITEINGSVKETIKDVIEKDKKLAEDLESAKAANKETYEQISSLPDSEQRDKWRKIERNQAKFNEGNPHSSVFTNLRTGESYNDAK